MPNRNRIGVPIQPNLDSCSTNHEMIKVGFQYLFGVNEIIINELNDGRQRDKIQEGVLEDHEGRIRDNEEKHLKSYMIARTCAKIGIYVTGSGGLLSLIFFILKGLDII